MPQRWDSYSDQPKMIHDKAEKRRIYRSVVWDFFKMLATNLLIFPIAWLFYLLIPAKKQTINTDNFFGISINADKNPQDTRQLIDDLQVNTLLIRMPLHDVENLSDYVAFAQQYSDKNLIINILQDRRHVEDHALLAQSLDHIFQQFSPLTQRFQIANAVNRKKWSIYSIDEYLKVYKVAQSLKKTKYPKLILLGSSIIDFEYYFTIRSLFNFQSIYYDQFSSLLYVDRRGNPENTQLGLDIRKKLYLLQAIIRLSRKASSDIVITESNWPIKNTHPYAPTSETECVSLEDHANYLVRYYLLVLSTGVVKNIYWHQLIAPGYGLIDNRDGQLKKYPSYYAFKTMLNVLQGSHFMELEQQGDLYHMSFQGKGGEQNIQVIWALQSTTINTQGKQIILRDGQEVSHDEMLVGESPIYLLDTRST